jgi:hypothetical protein
LPFGTGPPSGVVNGIDVGRVVTVPTPPAAGLTEAEAAAEEEADGAELAAAGLLELELLHPATITTIHASATAPDEVRRREPG